MALTHLADTSVLTRLATESVRTPIQRLVERGRLARASITDLEIGFSARSATEWDSLLDSLDAFGLIETTADHIGRARQVQRALAASGRRGRKVPDLIIAAAAEANDLVLVHYDSDFDLIAEVTGQPCEWVVPRGSID